MPSKSMELVLCMTPPPCQGCGRPLRTLPQAAAIGPEQRVPAAQRSWNLRHRSSASALSVHDTNFSRGLRIALALVRVFQYVTHCRNFLFGPAGGDTPAGHFSDYLRVATGRDRIQRRSSSGSMMRRRPSRLATNSPVLMALRIQGYGRPVTSSAASRS